MLSILTTVPADIPALGEKLADVAPSGVEILDRRLVSRADFVRRVVAADGKVDVLLLNGSGRLDQVAAAALWRRRSRTAVIISDCTWKVGSSLPDRLMNRLGIRAMDSPRVRYCVLSKGEAEVFPRTWGVDPARVAFTPFCYTLTDADLAETAASDGTVFAGGDSMRDYSMLIRAAPRIRAKIVLAARRPPGHVPENVVAGPVTHPAFVDLMRRASVVVVPLQPSAERSGGQQTYLNAMALEKIVVATDSLGVRDYIDDASTGMVVPAGDDEALAEAVNWALDPARSSEVAQMRARARAAATTRFTPLEHFEALLAVARTAFRGAAA